MSKSLYEKFADIEQPKVLGETSTFENAVESLKLLKSRVSAEYIDWTEEVTALIFNRTYQEVRDAVDGIEPWVSIAGMYMVK